MLDKAIISKQRLAVTSSHLGTERRPNNSQRVPTLSSRSAVCQGHFGDDDDDDREEAGVLA